MAAEPPPAGFLRTVTVELNGKDEKVPRGKITVKPLIGSGKEGTVITVKLDSGFPANTEFTVQFNGKAVTTDVTKTDGKGKAECKFSLPKNYAAGVTYEVKVTCGKGKATVFAYGDYTVKKDDECSLPMPSSFFSQSVFLQGQFVSPPSVTLLYQAT
jgi:hypothetical protein